MNRVERFERQDWIAATMIFAACIGLRIPFRSELAYHWDSVQFMLALNDFNVSLSQPHAPGYFLYVMLGRLANFFVGDPHASLMWMSVVFGSALPAVMYLLGAAMFNRRTGLAAALFAATSAQVWFHSCVALNYIVARFLFSHEHLDQVVEGEPDVLIEGGVIREDRLKKELLTRTELETAAHRQGFDGLHEIERAVIEPGGTIFMVGRKPSSDEIQQKALVERLDTISRQLAEIRQSLPPRQ